MAQPTPADRRWLWAAVELSRLCPPSATAFAVGAIVVDARGRELARGHSRDDGPQLHAEESALARLAEGLPDLAGATVYTSMEPCTARRSRPRTCTDLIIAAGVGRVVLALPEPPVFVVCAGIATLRAAGVDVVTIPELGAEVVAINAAVLR